MKGCLGWYSGKKIAKLVGRNHAAVAKVFELSLNRAALRHTNDLVDEKDAELAQLTERHATTEMYVAELRARVAKLSEREQSTEVPYHS